MLCGLENTKTRVKREEFRCREGNARKLKESRPTKPAHVKAPVSKTDPERRNLTLHGQRLRCAELEQQQLNDMKAELQKFNIEIDHHDELSNDFTRILVQQNKLPLL